MVRLRNLCNNDRGSITYLQRMSASAKVFAGQTDGIEALDGVNGVSSPNLVFSPLLVLMV